MLYTNKINNNKTFSFLYRKGKCIVSKHIVIYVRKNNKPFNNLGITAGKKVGNAVMRNRAKRIIRAAYTAAELKYILDCLEMEPLKWRCFVWLLCDTGIRRGECCGLQWKDIDFQNETITIARGLNYTPGKGVYEDTPKNSQQRTIDLSPRVLALLQQWRAEQAGNCISVWVFNQDHSSEPMHPQTPTRYLKKFSERYNVSGLHPHKLRHSFASVAITHGADIASVSEKLGHSDKAVTLRMYTHADAASIKQAGDIFRKALETG